MQPNGGSISKLLDLKKSPQIARSKGEDRRITPSENGTQSNGSKRISSLAKQLDIPILV